MVATDGIVNNYEKATGFSFQVGSTQSDGTFYLVPSDTAVNLTAIQNAAVASASIVVGNVTLSVTANHANLLDNKSYVIYAIASNGVISAPSTTAFTTNFSSFSTPIIVSVTGNSNTATVLVSGGTIGDIVSLMDGKILLATSAFDSSGLASLTTTALSYGTHQFTAIITHSNGLNSNPSPPVSYIVE